ncbi:MAG: FtsX-like permease family protein [Chitinivibrionales bacterium]|nr:FtsX-like permease family protein [Chitinivibrionales bacterium]MBD3357554.1 FtsX-like permease family protein [Chitinivibrionales bacterium]
MLGYIVRALLVGTRMSVVEMRSHKLRSALSMIGVMLGVAALVAMLSLVGGIRVFLDEKLSTWAGSIWVWQKWNPEEGEEIAWSRSPGLRLSDGEWLEEHSPQVARAYRAINRRDRVHVAGHTLRSRQYAVDSVTFAEDRDDIKLKTGRWFTKADYSNGRRVCLIGWELAKQHQKAAGRSGDKKTPLVGRQVLYGKVSLEIVGIYEPKDPDFHPWHLRRTVVLPVRTMQKYVTGLDPDPGSIRLALEDAEAVGEQAKRVARELKTRHRGVEDFEYRGSEHVEKISSMLENMSLLMSIISVISLLVGGMSIMNVMLSSITERIHEIGVRKALGAKTLQIFVQFIAETTTLSFTGGLVGIGLGSIPLFFKEAIKKSTDGAISPTILPQHALLVFVIIAGVGVFFGLYPAVKASSMDPVEALRYE